MERRDAENAANCAVPEETIEAAPETYADVSIDAFLEFCKQMFRYWTEDDFAAAFRRMLTVEQYRSGERNALYHQYLGAGPLQYTADVLGSKAQALALYGPMYLLYGVYDQAEDKAAVIALLEAHLRSWQAQYNEEIDRETKEAE